MSEWAIDTGVIVASGSGTDRRCLAAARLLHGLLERHRVLLDFKGDIVREYQPYLTPPSLPAQWWAQMNRVGRFTYRSNSLPRKVASRLERLRFDRSDCKFVGLALRSPDRLLVAEESDYWADDRVTRYIQNDLSINLLKIDEAIARL